jgi:phage repressor protein C with HTH and peptisase S24 domain
MSNVALNNILFSHPTIADMHPSAERLYHAARELMGVVGQSKVARLLGESPQTLKNWEGRGVSKGGAIKAQSVIGANATWITDGTGRMSAIDELPRYPVSSSSNRRLWVVGKGQGGLPERVWTDADYPVGATDEYADISTADPQAFLVPVVGDSMAPRFQPGEYALVEPSTEPEIEDDVLVRLATGETLLKRLLSRRHGTYRFGSWNDKAILTYPAEEVVWVYYVPHNVPARKIKMRHP